MTNSRDKAPECAATPRDVLTRFESAWKQAAAGGPEPSVESFLSEVSVNERSALRAEMEKLSVRYRRERSDTPPPGRMATVEFTPAAAGANTPEPAAAGTVEFRTEPLAGPAATVGLPGGTEDDGFVLAGEPATDDRTQLEAADRHDASRGERPTVPGHEILCELGRGGMGVVYKALQVKLQRLVALKMVLAGAHAGAEQLKRFYAEAQAVAHLQHPNIVQIYEVAEQAGLPYFSLEFVDGGSLAQKAAGKPQPVRDAAHMVESLARAMHYAHQNDVVHRDLKPANVLLTASGIPKITDFGLAKRLEEGSSSQTRSGAILGTPSYMAPEQAMGEVHRVGPLTDVYSLGAILYELLTGRPPFAGPTPMDTVVQVTRDEPVAPSQLQPKIPPDLETICLKCLQKDQPKRYASAAELADDLRRFLAGEPIVARPIAAPERLWRWCRRNPKVAVLSGAVALLLVTVTAVSTVMAIQIAHERDQTELERKAAVTARDLARTKELEAIEARELADRKARDEEAAKVVAQEAQKLADENAQVASAQNKLALETLLGLVVDVQEQLKDRPDMKNFKVKLLENATKGLDRVVDRAENAALAGRTAGGIYQRTGDILLQEEGHAEAAREQYEKALRVFQALMDELPHDDPEWEVAIYNTAIMHVKLGDVIHQLEGNSDGIVLKRYEKALELRKQLITINRKHPQLTSALVNRALAESYIKRGNLLQIVGDPTEALADFTEAFTLRQQLVQEYPDSPITKGDLAGVYAMLGEAQFRLKDRQASENYYQTALTMRRELYNLDQESTQAQRSLSNACAKLGDLYLQWSEPKVAQDYYDEGHALCQKAFNADPKKVENQRDLAWSHYRLGTAALALNDLDRSQGHYRNCLELREKVMSDDASNVHKMFELMHARARCGLHREAAQIGEELQPRVAKDPGILYFVSCGYALCSAAVARNSDQAEIGSGDKELLEHYVETAVRVLGDAVSQGFRDVTTIELDPDLEPLRTNEQFKSLIDKLKNRAG